jgi:hypothetical protein
MEFIGFAPVFIGFVPDSLKIRGSKRKRSLDAPTPLVRGAYLARHESRACLICAGLTFDAAERVQRGSEASARRTAAQWGE